MQLEEWLEGMPLHPNLGWHQRIRDSRMLRKKETLCETWSLSRSYLAPELSALNLLVPKNPMLDLDLQPLCPHLCIEAMAGPQVWYSRMMGENVPVRRGESPAKASGYYGANTFLCFSGGAS